MRALKDFLTELEHGDGSLKTVPKRAGINPAGRRARQLRNFILVIPEMIAQIQAWMETAETPVRLKCLHGYMLTYLYHPADYVPDGGQGIFGYLDDAYVLGSIYLMLLAQGRPVIHLSNMESISRQLPFWMRMTRLVLPTETRRIDGLLDDLGRQDTSSFQAMMGGVSTPKRAVGCRSAQ